MERDSWILAAILVFSFSSANAAPAGQAALTSALHGLQAEGFYGAAAVAVPQAPSAPAATSSGGVDDHAKQVLAAYAQELMALQVNIHFSGTVARRLGFAPSASTPWVTENQKEFMPVRCITRIKDSTGEGKWICATDARGKTEIILVYSNPHVELRSYVASVDGVEAGAVVENNSGTSDIPSPQSGQELQTELGFWVRYYDKTHSSGH